MGPFSHVGADAIGGIDPCTLDRDPVRHLDTVMAAVMDRSADRTVLRAGAVVADGLALV